MTDLAADETVSVVEGVSAKTRVIDCDVHPNFAERWTSELAEYFSPEWAVRFKGSYRYAGKDASERSSVGYSMPHNAFYPRRGAPMREDLMGPGGAAPATDPAVAAAELLDAHDIDRAILLPQGVLGIGAFPNGLVACEIASAANAWMADRWLDADDRWRGTICVAVQDANRAAEEIDKWGADPRFVGVFMPLSNRLMGDNTFYPIYEAATRHGLPIMLHPFGGEGIYTTSPSFAGGPPTFHIDHRVAFTHPYQVNLANLVATGAFERFPGLKVVFCEFGYAWLPDLMWRMDTFWKSGREDTPWIKVPPSEYILNHCRFTTQPFIEPPRRKYIAQILEMISADRTLLFSTDYPHWDSDEPDKILADIPAEMRSRILFENALETFGQRIA